MAQLAFFKMIGMTAVIFFATMNFLHTLVKLYPKPNPLATVSWNG